MGLTRDAVAVCEAGEDREGWARFCEATSEDYPFARPPRDESPPLNMYSWRILRPVVYRFLAASLPALVLAIVASAYRFTFGPRAVDAVEISSAKTPRNAFLAARLRRVLDAMPPPTPWLVGGDLCTLAPFLLFGADPKGIRYERRWLRVAASPAPDGADGFRRRSAGGGDDEAVAMDVRFPERPSTGETPVFLLLHGLNGGSSEPYVHDFVGRANAAGAICAVLVARGLMRTPVRAEPFNGARTGDVASAAAALRESFGDRVVLVGFSMGGIIAMNYAARSGADSNLVAAVALSGNLSCARTTGACGDRGKRVWQPFLAYSLKDSFTGPNRGALKRRGVPLGPILDAGSISAFDEAQVVPFARYPGLVGPGGYYGDMSAAGDGDGAGLAKLANLAVPGLVLHARDDPITPIEAQLPAAAAAAAANLTVLSTASGGHTGWPRGPDPRRHKWRFMAELGVAFGFGALASRPFGVDVGDGPIFDENRMPRRTPRSRAARDPPR